MAQAHTTIRVELIEPTETQLKRWLRRIKKTTDKLARDGICRCFLAPNKRRIKKAARRRGA